MLATRYRAPLAFLLLAALMAATRLHHFSAVPDASWAVFFMAGFYLRGSMRWAFPLLMVVAVLVDYIVISRSGINFWTHYCVSPGYWFLLPAHFVLWAAGDGVARLAKQRATWGLAALVPLLVVGVALCHLFAQGGFYWFSSSWGGEATFAGWWKNYLDWLPPYLTSTASYVGVVAIGHIAVQVLLASTAPATQRND